MALGDFLFPQLELTLSTVHEFEVDVEAVSDRMSKEYQSLAARVHLNDSDMKRLKLNDGDTVSIASKTAAVIVQAFTKETLNEGIAIMPRSPWAMKLVPVPSGSLHGIAVTVKGEKKEVTPIGDLLKSP
jgi:formylmethanofuran dehydrogenase subunit D